SLRAVLAAQRPAVDWHIINGNDHDMTPPILAEAKRQRLRAVMLGIWDPRSAAEIAGVAELVRQYHADLALAVCVGNEGIMFRRYTFADLDAAATRLHKQLEKVRVPLSTSEPAVEYAQERVRRFGDFCAPNVHPVFDKKELTDPAGAASWARDRALAIAETARRPVLVKETGFASAGAKHFSPAAQAAF